MKRLVIADAHIGQRADDVHEMEKLLVRAAAAGVGEVIFLGDAFQYLIGMAKFWTPAVREVLALWQTSRQNGVRVLLVEGNRDFFLDHPDIASEIDWSGRCLEFGAGQRRYRLVHGDQINRQDRQYLFWSALSKSAVARLWARLLPRTLAVSIVRNMEARLARTNREFRLRKPIPELRRTADRAWAEGVDVVLWGHFHSFWQYKDGDRQAMVLPAWMNTNCALLVEANGEFSIVDQKLEPVSGTVPRTPVHGDDEEI